MMSLWRDICPWKTVITIARPSSSSAPSRWVKPQRPRGFAAATNAAADLPNGVPRGKPGRALLDRLCAEVEALDQALRPPKEQYLQKQEFVDSVKPLLERKTGGTFHTFGSCENGFWMRGSDVDSCLVLPATSHRLTALSKLRVVQALIQRAHQGKSTVEVIPARVPVAKVRAAVDNSERGDISVNNTTALENSSLVAALSGLDPRVRPLGRVLKHWATQRQINERSQGTLSTYTIILLLFYLMQTKWILPRFADIAIPSRANDPLVDEAGNMRQPPFRLDAPPMRSPPQDSLGELFYDFFQLFGDSLFGGGAEGRTIEDAVVEPNDLGVLVMKCSLSGKNVNPFTIEMWQAIHSEFVRAKDMLEADAPLSAICAKADAPPIGAKTTR